MFSSNNPSSPSAALSGLPMLHGQKQPSSSPPQFSAQVQRVRSSSRNRNPSESGYASSSSSSGQSPNSYADMDTDSDAATAAAAQCLPVGRLPVFSHLSK